jgi:hypothetical protein
MVEQNYINKTSTFFSFSYNPKSAKFFILKKYLFFEPPWCLFSYLDCHKLAKDLVIASLDPLVHNYAFGSLVNQDDRALKYVIK